MSGTDLTYAAFAAFVVAGLALFGYTEAAGGAAFGAAIAMAIQNWWGRGAA